MYFMVPIVVLLNVCRSVVSTKRRFANLARATLENVFIEAQE